MNYVWFVRGAKHAAMCAASIESVRKVDPKARLHVVTDEERHDWTLPATECRIESGLPIMLANLEAQCQLLATIEYGEPVTFLDADVLMLAPLEFSAGVDLVTTWRDHVGVTDEGEKVEGIASRMPYNYGVLGAVAGYRSVEAFIWMRERIRQMSARRQLWYGNQLALAELAGPRPESGSAIESRRIPWQLTQLGNPVTISKLPCERFNYTPSKVGEATHEKRAFLHFKGHARSLMESYAKRIGIEWKAAA